MKTIILITLGASAMIIRGLAWLSFVQQKEYRFDRLLAFFRSGQARGEFCKVVPARSDFTRRGLRRPRFTARALIVAILAGGMSWFAFVHLFLGVYALFGFLRYIQLVQLPNVFRAIVSAVSAGGIVYLFLPVFVVAAALISSLPVWLVVYIQLVRARRALQASKPLIIGIGGSYGKTSTKYLLAAVLSEQHSVFMTPKSHNTALSVAASILHPKTGYRSQDIALLEYGAYRPGEIAQLASWFSPNHAVITGFTPQHLELFGSLEASVRSEAELVAAIGQSGSVFYNQDDDEVQHIITAGIQNKSDVQQPKLVGYAQSILGGITMAADGSLNIAFGDQNERTRLVGMQYASNCAAAVVVARQLGMSDAAIAAGLRKFEPDERFVRSYHTAQGHTVLDDGGTSNPKGFAASIDLAKSLAFERKYLFTSGLVDLGNMSQQVHTDLATHAASVFDAIVYFGELGKKEFAAQCDELLITDESAVAEFVASLSDDGNHSREGDDAPKKPALIVIEGKMPGSAGELLASLGVRKR